MQALSNLYTEVSHYGEVWIYFSFNESFRLEAIVTHSPGLFKWSLASDRFVFILLSYSSANKDQ